MTHLKSYLKDNGIRQRTLAETIGVSRAYMSDLCNGKRTPSFAVARKISDATGGEVGFESWPVAA